jgi:glyoxylase-like metal-dependent hydrolase (beta-lactamase superfamily II)
MDGASPYPTVYNVSGMIEGWDKLRRLAESPAHIIPGHDPRGMDQYPALSDALQGRVARLDVDPRD